VTSDQTPSPNLTPREIDVLNHLAAGNRPAGIASDLGIKEVTVHMHIRTARAKLNAPTRESAIARAIGFGLITVTL